MSAERTMATETFRSRSPGCRDRVVEVRERDQRRRAAADAVEQRHHLRHRGHLHRARRVRPDRRRDGHDEDHPDELVRVEAGQEERRHDGDGHAEGADPVAVARSRRVGEVAQREDEADDRDDVRQRDPVAARHSSGSFFGGSRRLNICSIRSVTTNPPTTLPVPSATATSATIRTQPVWSGSEATMIAPTTTMPWIAFEPDMSGVCRSVGTFAMTSKPRNAARISTVSSMRNDVVTRPPPFG